MKHIRYALLLLALLAGGWGPASAQVFDWAKLAQDLVTSHGYSQASTTDLNGNTYTSVRFRDSVRVGGVRLTATGPADVLIKYDSTGHVAWTKVMRGVTFDNNGLKVNPATGDLFMLGSLQAGATWNGSPVIGGAGAGYFYGKCSPTGALLWARSRPYLLNTALQADELGNCYFIGQSPRTNTVGGISADSSSLVLVQAGGNGVVQWQRKLRGTRPVGVAGGGTGLGYFYGLGPKPGGGVLVFGQFISALYYHTSTLPVQTNATTQPVLTNFVANIDVNGGLLWSRDSPRFSLMTAAAGDPAGNYYVTGQAYFSNINYGGIGLVKCNNAGTEQWVKTEAPVNSNGGRFAHMVAVDAAGNVTIVADGQVGGPVPTVIGTLVLRAYTNVVHFDAQGQEKWVANDWWPGYSPASSQYVGAVALGLDRRGNVYYTAEITGDSLHNRPTVQLGAHTLVGAGVLVSRIGTRHNTISGNLYLDSNGNGVRDAGEGSFPIPLVLEATQPTYVGVAAPDATGDYYLTADAGSYSVTVPQVPAGFGISQPASSTYTGSFSGYGNVDPGRDIGIRALVNRTDLRATLTAYGAARPGFTTRYRLTLENVGTVAVPAGTATVTLDARAVYVSSTPTASVTGRVVSWNYAAIAPFGRRELDVIFSLPVNTAAGVVLTTTGAAPVAGDATADDNTATYSHTVTNSYDPNEIEVNYARLTPTQVAARQPLDYTIHFQNLGTAEAVTVAVSDTLDVNLLNPASLMLVAQSHNCIWSPTTLSGNRCLLTVRFVDINLPTRNTDVIRSQGFVRFRVQPRATLAVGTVIPNHAGIVFDYNSPVITNTATTTVFLASAALARHDAPAWNAYPNPATDAVTVSADLATGGRVQLDLLDALGRPVRHQTLTAPAGALRQALDLRGLAPGLYVLRLTPPTGPASTQQLVRE